MYMGVFLSPAHKAFVQEYIFLRFLLIHRSHRQHECPDTGGFMELLFLEPVQFGFLSSPKPFCAGAAPTDGTESPIQRTTSPLDIFNTASFKQTRIHMEGCEGLSD